MTLDEISILFHNLDGCEGLLLGAMLMDVWSHCRDLGCLHGVERVVCMHLAWDGGEPGQSICIL